MNHSVLFEKLLRRKLSPVVLRTLLAWYTDQRMCVRWNHTESNKFHISNGVRQGGVLSPILFTIYVDELLDLLKSAGVGCHWNHHFVGAICYADDIALLAPSPAALRIMLRTCSSFAESHSLIFNAGKSQLITFARTPSATASTSLNFSFCGQSLPLCETVSHLGHTLSSDFSDDADIVSTKKAFCRKANYMLYTFACCDPLTKTNLFRNFCMLLYGSAIWSSSSKELKSLEVCYNNVIHKIWHLPQICHTSVLHLVSGLPSIFNTVVSRSYSLTAAALQSSSPLIADIFGDATKLVYTSSGFNLCHGHKLWKSYNVSDIALAKFVFDVKLSPHLNSHL